MASIPKTRTVFINVKLDEKIFRDFSFFNTFTRPKRWARLGLFLFLMALFAVICFLMEGGLLLGCVLLGVGIVVPAVYVGSFLLSVNKEAKKAGLSADRPVYTVELSRAPDGIRVQSSTTAQMRFQWAECDSAWHRNGCTYLYAAPNRAFLLPDAQIKGKRGREELWQLLAEMLPAEKLHDSKR